MFKEYSEPEFKLNGDSAVLKEMIINIESYANDSTYPGFIVSKMQSKLFNGTQQSFQNDGVLSYTIYCSYKNKVNALKFDNTYGNRDGHVNNIYIFKRDGEVYLRYCARELDITQGKGRTIKIGLSLESYLEQSNVKNKEDQEQYQKNFFCFFKADIQEYKLRPISEVSFDYYKGLSLENKKKFNVPPEYLKQMGLPENELKELLEL